MISLARPIFEEAPMSSSSSSNSAPRAPAWQRRKAFREKEILDAAVALLVEVGVDNLSMIEVARRAGVSEATVYKYFDNRQEIVARAMGEALTPRITALEEEIKFINGCEARLRFFIARSLQDMAARPNVHRATHGHMRWSGEYKTLLRDMHRRFGRLVQSIFEQGVKDGELKPDADFVLAGDMIFGGIESAGWRTLLAGKKMGASLDEFAATFARQLLGGMETNKAPPAATADRLEQLIERMERRLSR